MSKSRLSSGKIKKLSGNQLTLDRYEYLDVSQAEPDLGLPAFNNAVLIGEINGQRFWSNTLTNLTISASTLTNTFITNSTLSNSVINSGTITGNLLPSVTDAYNLGSPTQRFKTLYVSSATIDIGGVIISSSGTDALNISKLIVTTSTNSTSTVTGALVISGGVGIGQDLWIGGDIYSTRLDISGIALSNISGALGVSTVNITSSTNSTSTNSGALIVNGGVGIGKNLYVGSNIHSKNVFIDTLTTGSIVVAYNNGQLITPGTFLRWITPGNILSVTGSLELSNTATFTSTQTSVSTNTGALTVAGGVGIGGDLYVGGEIVAQKLTIEYTTVTTTYIVTDDIISTTNTTPSTNTQTGALVIAGGVGIGGTLTGKIINVDRVNAGEVFDNFNRVLTSVTPYAGDGISISTPAYTGADVSFTVTNIGVLSVTAGTDTAVTTNAGVVNVWNTSTLQTVSDRGNSTTNAIAITNTTSSTSTGSGALVVAGGVGVGGALYVAADIYSNTQKVVTTSTFGQYISVGTDTRLSVNSNNGIVNIWNDSTLDSVTARGAVTHNEIRILSIQPAFSSTSGALTVAGGVGISQDLYVGGTITATNFNGSFNGSFNGTFSGTVAGTSTYAAYANTATYAFTATTATYAGYLLGGNTNQIPFQTASSATGFSNSLTFNGNTLFVGAITSATSTDTGALQVLGGTGIGGDLYVGGKISAADFIYSNGQQVITTATINQYANQTTIIAGTDTAVSTSTGNITIWNTSTLQTVSDRGNSTTNVISIINTTSSTSTTTGALTVTGGVGVGGDLYIGGALYQGGQQVITTATINQFANQTTITAGTDTAISTSTGNITIWNTSTLQSITDRGAVTTNNIRVNQLNIGPVYSVGSYTNAFYINQYGIYNEAASNNQIFQLVTNVTTSSGGILTGVGGGLWTGGGTGIVNFSSGDITFRLGATLHQGSYPTGGTNPAGRNIVFSSTGSVIINSNDVSSSTTQGALVVKGGVGIAGNLYVGGKVYSTVTNAENILNNTATNNTSYYLGLLDKVGQQSSVNSDNALKYITSSTTTGTAWTSGTNVLSVPGSIYSVDGNSDLGNLLYTPRVTVGPIPHTGARPSDFWVDPSTSAIYQWIVDAGNGYWLQIAII